MIMVATHEHQLVVDQVLLQELLATTTTATATATATAVTTTATATATVKSVSKVVNPPLAFHQQLPKLP